MREAVMTEKKHGLLGSILEIVGKFLTLVLIPFGKAKNWWQRKGGIPGAPTMRDERDRYRR